MVAGKHGISELCLVAFRVLDDAVVYKKIHFQ